MKVIKTSALSGKTRIREIDVTKEQIAKWERGDENIQDIMPHLSADDREFLMTGATPDEWIEAFGGDEDDEDSDESAF